MKIIFLDTETTGLNPPKDGLEKIAIADISGTVLLNTRLTVAESWLAFIRGPKNQWTAFSVIA